MERGPGAQPTIPDLMAFWGGGITLTAKYSGKHDWDGQTAAEFEGSREETWQLFPDDPINKSLGGDSWEMRAVWRAKVRANGLITYKDSSTKETAEGQRSDEIIVSVRIFRDGQYVIGYFGGFPQVKKALKRTTVWTGRGAGPPKVEEANLGTYMLHLRGREGSPSVSAYRISGLIDPQDPATLSGTLDFAPQGTGLGSWTSGAFGLFSHVKGPAQETLRLTWNLTRRAGNLKANPGGPYSVVRGETLTLDASASEGEIDSYDWTFAAPDEGGGPIVAAKTASDAGQPDGGAGPPDAGQVDGGVPWSGNPNARKQGKKVPFRPLQKTKVTLTVIGRGGTDSATITVLVEPRGDFKTKYDPERDDDGRTGVLPVPRPGESPLVGDYTLLPVAGARIMVATNLCKAHSLATLKDFRSASHILHVPGDWDAEVLEDIAYTLKQSDDESGAFKGCWYVEKILFTIHRKVYRNPFFVKDGPTPNQAAKPDGGAADNWYETQMSHSLDPDRYLEAATQHERTHSQLIKEKLQQEKQDPGPEMEKLCGRDKDALNARLWGILRAAEFALDEYMKNELDVRIPPGKFSELWKGLVYTWDESQQQWDVGPDSIVGYPARPH